MTLVQNNIYKIEHKTPSGTWWTISIYNGQEQDTCYFKELVYYRWGKYQEPGSYNPNSNIVHDDRFAVTRIGDKESNPEYYL